MTKSTPPNDEEVTKIGPYTVIKALKKGDFADFFVVERMDSRFVLAQLHNSYAQDPSFISLCKEAYARYREVSSPYVVKLYELTVQEEVYLVMERLGAAPKAGTMVPEKITLKRIENLGEALDSIHAQGHIHGFLHPSCIRLRENGEAVLAGLEQQLSSHMRMHDFESYRPPEEYGEATKASDVYALALCAYYLWSGALPWEARCTVAEARLRKEGDQLRPLAAFGYSEALSAVMSAALSADPSKRFTSCSALVKALKNPIQYRPVRKAEEAAPTISAEKEGMDVKAMGRDVSGFVLRIAIIALVMAALFFGRRFFVTSEPSVQVTQQSAGESKEKPKAYGVKVRGVSLELVPIRNAEVTLGALNRDRSAAPDEKKHTMTLSKGYYISQTEVTQELWQAVMGENPSKNKDPARPVDSISWFDAIQFCNALSKLRNMKPVYTIEGDQVAWDPSVRGFRLPTEAEWEYAARGGESVIFSGSYEVDVGWYVQTSKGRSHAVGELKPNAWGLVDMSGNVAEWVWDWYPCERDKPCEEPYPPESADYKGPQSGSERVIRGGSFKDFKKSLRSSARQSLAPQESRTYVGLRIAL